MRVFLAGATGVIGRPLTKQLVAAGHEVTGLTRSEKHAGALRDAGVRPAVADVYDRDAIISAVSAARAEVVIHQLTAIPRAFAPQQAGVALEPTNRLRTEGTEILLAAARAAGANRFIAQSVSFILAPDGPSPAGEEPVWDAPPHSVAHTFAAAAKMEAMLAGAGDLATVVLRYGFLYGPHTTFDDDGSMIEQIRRRRLPIVGRGEGMFGFCHVDDAAAATVRALERGRGVYNIVDNDPAPSRLWIPFLAEQVGAKRPFHVPVWLARILAGPYAVYLMTQQRAVSNAKARGELGFIPSIPSWRQGMRRR
ncbi:MAG: NAD(P)-dependent oxidoreductase [Deltaproteobacteria bacterium]|nr:NAD(P)-dependent oxidoreductase [Deltaproteobacteria bacterium]